MALLSPSSLSLLPAPEGHASFPLGLGFGLDPLVLLGLALAAILYARGLRRWRMRSYRYSGWHPVAFCAALAILLVALQSPLDHLSEELLAAHMVQHMLLSTWATPLLVLGAPLTPILRGLPSALRLGVVRPLARNRVARRLFPVLVRPLPAFVLMTGALWGWHLPAAYEFALGNDAAHALQHVSFALTAGLFWAALMDIHPLHSRLSYLGRIVFLLAAMAQTTALSLFLVSAQPGLYPFYAQESGAWGLSPAQDQQAAGLIMLADGLMMYLAAMVVCALVWLGKEERRDEEEERVAARAGAPGP
ncbi:MAG: cytochrome c oxidase assembly protein [Dehalococcoidia bacterium]|nr:cytochrome c oxidase assembly protein [Dehalococcoidia bacterium]